jgi:hypothetical protein
VTTVVDDDRQTTHREDPHSTDTSTVPDVDAADQEARSRRGAWARHAFAAALALFLVLALLGAFGVRMGSVAGAGTGAGGDEVTLTVRYAEVSRPGLATPWTATVEATGDAVLPATVVLETTSAYFDQFDENGLDPEPTEVFQDEEWLSWTFEPPPGTRTLTVVFDARLEPGIRWGRPASTRLIVDDEVLVHVDYRTWIVP